MEKQRLSISTTKQHKVQKKSVARVVHASVIDKRLDYDGKWTIYTFCRLRSSDVKPNAYFGVVDAELVADTDRLLTVGQWGMRWWTRRRNRHKMGQLWQCLEQH